MENNSTPVSSEALHRPSSETPSTNLSAASAGPKVSSNLANKMPQTTQLFKAPVVVIPDDGRIRHSCVHELRADPRQLKNWTKAHLTRARATLVRKHMKPSGLPHHLETLLKSSNPSLPADAPEHEKELAEAQKDIAPLNNKPFSVYKQMPVRRFYDAVFEFYFGTCDVDIEMDLKIPGGKIVSWYPVAIVGNNLARAITQPRDNPYEDVAYLLSFAQTTGNRRPYLLSYHGSGRVSLLTANIDETYMTALMKADMKDVKQELKVELAGYWDIMKEQDRIEFVGVMADLSKLFGAENAGDCANED